MARILSMRFNQLNSCVAVGTTRGYRIYNCLPFAKGYDSSTLPCHPVASLLASWLAGRNGTLTVCCGSVAGEGGAGLVEMLFHTSLVSLVGAGEQAAFSPRRLRLVNTKTETEICDLNFVHTVVNVRLNRQRLIALLENKIHLFDLKTMKLLHTLDTVSNPTGVCALSPSVDNCFLAFPASNSKGEILIYDALNLQVINTILAHDAAVRLLAFNADGTMLASVSQKGTVIRVFSIPDGKKLFTFRRGSYEAVVNSLSFNSTSTLIAVSSTTSSTVHIFSLNAASPDAGAGAGAGVRELNGKAGADGKADPLSPANGSGSSGGRSSAGTPPLSHSPTASAPVSTAAAMANSASTTAAAAGAAISATATSLGSAAAAHGSKLLKMIPGSLFPTALTNYMDPSRHFARVHLKDGTQVCACGMLGVDQVLVITSAGHLFRYRVPAVGSKPAGDCKLEAEHTLLDHPSEIIGVKFIATDTAAAATESGAKSASAAATSDSDAAIAATMTASTVQIGDHKANHSTGLKIQTAAAATTAPTATAATTNAAPKANGGGFMDHKYSRPAAVTSSGNESKSNANTIAIASTVSTPSPASGLPAATGSGAGKHSHAAGRHTNHHNHSPPTATTSITNSPPIQTTSVVSPVQAVAAPATAGSATGNAWGRKHVHTNANNKSHTTATTAPSANAGNDLNAADAVVTTNYSSSASSIVVAEEDD